MERFLKYSLKLSNHKLDRTFLLTCSLIIMDLTPTILYDILSKNLGSQNWWPIDKDYHKKNNSDSRFEVIIGAILTQNTAWSNVEKALTNLKSYKKFYPNYCVIFCIHLL